MPNGPGNRAGTAKEAAGAGQDQPHRPYEAGPVPSVRRDVIPGSSRTATAGTRRAAARRDGAATRLFSNLAQAMAIWPCSRPSPPARGLRPDRLRP